MSNASSNHTETPAAAAPDATGAAPHRGVVPWGPWLAVIYAVAVYFFAQIVGSLLIVIYPHLRGWSRAHGEAWLSGTVTAQFWYVVFAEALTFAAIWWFVRRRGAGLRSIGWRRLRGADIAYALIGFAVYFIVYLVALSLLSAAIPALNVNQKQDLGFSNPSGGLNLTLTFLSLVVLPPLAEETVFRGFLFSGLKAKLPVVYAALLTSLLFAVPHALEGDGSLLWVGAIDTFILSLVLCYLRQKTKSLWPGVFVHALKNGVAFWALYLTPLIHFH